MQAKMKRQIIKVLAGSALAFTLFGCSSQSAAPKTNAVKTHYVIKKLGAKKLAAAKAKCQVLRKEKSKEEAEYEKLQDQLKEDKDKQAQAEKEAEAAQQAQAAAQAKARQQAAQPATPVNRGNMNTAQTGRIVGNARSHIYHVPGQRGYRMNSANAVYFNSEQAAQLAGYRKALR